MSEELIKRMKDAIEGECDGLAITDAHAKAILAYVLEASPSPTSDAELPPLPKPWLEALYEFDPSMREYPENGGVIYESGAGYGYAEAEEWREWAKTACSVIAKLRAASTRTASDTRTAAGEAECDAAVPAAPAGQHDADEAARAWMTAHGYGNQSFGYALADLQSRIEGKDYEGVGLVRRLEVREAELLHQRHKSDRLMEVLMSVYNLAPNGEDITLPDGRVMRFKDPNAAETLHYLGRAIHAIPEKVAQIAAAGPACQGGITYHATAGPEPINDGIANYAISSGTQAATRTQADAGKAGAVTKYLAHGHRGDFYLMANARMVAQLPIHQVTHMPNWVFASKLFATGSTSAHQICIDAGIDPDGYKIERHSPTTKTESA